jgi:methyl-accepting chemotaxis protein
MTDRLLVETARLKNPRIRRRFLINRGFQLRFIAFAVVTAVVACTSFYAANCYFFYKYQGFAIESGFPASHPFFKMLANMEDAMTLIFAITSLSIIGIATLTGLVFSHRVAGPLFRLKNHFDRVARGETMSNINFRQGDYFDDVATAYNRQMEHLRGKLTQAEESLKASKKAS